MGLFGSFFKSFPEGCREAMRLSYEKHYELARTGSLPMNMEPHQAGLIGALGTRYKVRGVLPSYEHVLWVELAPFLLMSKEDSVEALTEYVLWQEQPSAAKRTWLAIKINKALSGVPSTDDNSYRSFAPIAFLNNVRWCELLDPETKSMLSCEATQLI
jgi:hypothetical protein